MKTTKQVQVKFQKHLAKKLNNHLVNSILPSSPLNKMAMIALIVGV